MKHCEANMQGERSFHPLCSLHKQKISWNVKVKTWMRRASLSVCPPWSFTNTASALKLNRCLKEIRSTRACEQPQEEMEQSFRNSNLVNPLQCGGSRKGQELGGKVSWQRRTPVVWGWGCRQGLPHNDLFLALLTVFLYQNKNKYWCL